jgi:hypothetical protein
MTQPDPANPLDDRLSRLGQALDRAVRADLAVSRSRRARLLRRPHLLAGAAVVGVLVPAAAIAATQLITTSQVAASLPQGTRALIGTNPSCTAVVANVEYHCTLAKPPVGAGAPTSAWSPATADWTGTVEPTVDATLHVNGGCRALSAAGTAWECYIGEAAVQQSIISQGFLGQYAPAPGVG